MNASAVFDELRDTVRARITRERGGAVVDDLEIRRTLNELSAEMRAGKSFEDALAIAARPIDGLGDEDPPVATGLLPRLPTRPRPVLVSATVSDEERQARERALFEERRRRAEAARPAPKPMPPKAPIKPEPKQTTGELAVEVLEVLKRGPKTAYDIAWALEGDPATHDVGAALWMLQGRRLVERHGRGRICLWRLVHRDLPKGAPS